MLVRVVVGIGVLLAAGTAPAAKPDCPASAECRADPGAAAPQSDFSGHYYLHGIHEVGSELLLRADGTYEWFLAYGAMDQQSEGHWQREGDAITLTPNPIAKDTPIFSLGPILPWDDAFERLPQDEAYEALVAKFKARCPFLYDEDSMVESAMAPSSFDPPTPAQIKRAADAAGAEKEARAAFEQAASSAVNASDLDRGPRSAEAKAARLVWQGARDAMRQAEVDAGLRYSKLAGPVLPGRCAIPDQPDPATIKAADRIGGYAVKLSDPSVGLSFSGILVTFQYSDATVATATSNNGGRAWAPHKAGVALTGVTLGIRTDETAAMQQQSFKFAIARDTIQAIAVNSRAVTPPPFTSMRLRIDGDELVGFDDRGRYAKAR
jgi:hypothetical protein